MLYPLGSGWNSLMVEGGTFSTLCHRPTQCVIQRQKRPLGDGPDDPDCGILAWRRVLELTRSRCQWELRIVRHCRKGCMLTMLIVRGQSRQRRMARKGPIFGQKTVNCPRIGQKHPQWAFVLCPPTARRRRRSILASPFITLLIPNYRNVWFILNLWGRYTASVNRKVTTVTLGYLPCHHTV